MPAGRFVLSAHSNDPGINRGIKLSQKIFDNTITVDLPSPPACGRGTATTRSHPRRAGGIGPDSIAVAWLKLRRAAVQVAHDACEMRAMSARAALLLCASAPASTAVGAGMPRTFGKGIPNHPFTTTEVELNNHTLSHGASSGMITHFWSTACGAGVSFKGGLDSGVAIYR